MSNITKAVIPAAGLGTRMKPISNYLPKSMMPLGRKPVLEHITDELKEAGIKEIAIVKRSSYSVIEEYFSKYKGFYFIDDDSRSGPGGALLKAEEFIGEEDFVTVFADAPVKGEQRSSHLQNLISVKQIKNTAAAISIYQIPQSEISSRGVVTFANQGLDQGPVQLADIIEKPSKSEQRSRWASACRYVLGNEIFDRLRNISRDGNREIQLTPALQRLISEGRKVLGVPLPDYMRRYDTGNFKGYFEAFEDFAE